MRHIKLESYKDRGCQYILDKLEYSDIYCKIYFVNGLTPYKRGACNGICAHTFPLTDAIRGKNIMPRASLPSLSDLYKFLNGLDIDTLKQLSNRQIILRFDDGTLRNESFFFNLKDIYFLVHISSRRIPNIADYVVDRIEYIPSYKTTIYFKPSVT